MSFTIVTRAGINIGADQWAFTITGDPTSGAGLKAAIGSVCVQLDSVPANLFWEKTGPLQTDWSALSASGSAGVSAAAASDGSFRASAYSVPVDGSTDAVATLATLTGTTMPATGGPYRLIVGPGETIKLATDVTLPATVQLVGTGGLIKPASGKRLVVNAQPVATGKLFDHSAGGAVVSGRALTADPRWWGADSTGVADSTAAFDAAYGFVAQDATPGGGVATGTWGGKVLIPPGTYNMAGYGKAFGAGYLNLLIEGSGASTVLQSPAGRVIGVAPEWEGLITYYGGTKYQPSHHTIRDLTFKGAGASDATTFIIWDQGSELSLENLRFQDNGIESVRALSGTDVNKVKVHNCHATNVGRGRGAAWMNIGAQEFIMTNCTVDNSSIGLETGNSYTLIANCRFKDMTQWGTMIFSTWSGFLDSSNSYVQYNAYNAQIANCEYINIPNRAILMPDFNGHTNADAVHPSPAHLDGNVGQVTISGCSFDRTAICIWGGADLGRNIDVSGNNFAGQYDAGTGPQTYAIGSPSGTWTLHDNIFQIGQGIAWSALLGDYVTTRSTYSRLLARNNTVINKCWASLGFNLKENDTIAGTRFIDSDGSIVADTAHPMIVFNDLVSNTGAGGPIAMLYSNEWAWQNPDHQISMLEPCRLPVTSNSLPATFSFKPGDVLVNVGNNSAITWFNKKCVTGGSTNPTPLVITGAATSGTKTLTVSANTGLMKYGWISFPAVPAVTPKRILGISGTTITVDTNFEATVTAGTSLQWAVPTFVTDRDVSSLTIASQAAGDTVYASSATAWTRLPKGVDGTTQQLVSGLPAWVDATAVYDAGNSSTAITLTRTPARQEQKVTLTTATPAITINSIPSGGYLFIDMYQDGTGSRIPTWTSDMGALNWVGGSPPTWTTTAGKYDRVEIRNDNGSRYTAVAVLLNA